MARHLVLGAGGIGVATAEALAATGGDVVLVSRSGRDPGLAGVTAYALDVADAAALTDLARGAQTLVNALNPTAYTHWERDWPPMASAILDAAEASGARLITVSNLYGYGRVDAPMTESTPLSPNGTKGEVRARMWSEALERQTAGRVRVAEVRGSDYIGPKTLGSSLVSSMLIPKVLAGKTAWMPMGRTDVPHSWTVDLDVAALVRAIAASDEPDVWGRVWHVPTAGPATMAEVGDLVVDVGGVEGARVRAMPRSVVTVGGLVVPLLGELRETRHQFERPFVLDSTAAQTRFGLRPTPLRDALALTVDAVRAAAR